VIFSVRRGVRCLQILQPRSRPCHSSRHRNGRSLRGCRTKGSCRSRRQSTSCCSIGRVERFGRTSAGRFLTISLRSSSGWVWIERTGCRWCANSVACSSRRPVERVHLSKLRHVAQGGGFRVSLPHKPRSCNEAVGPAALRSSPDRSGRRFVQSALRPGSGIRIRCGAERRGRHSRPFRAVSRNRCARARANAASGTHHALREWRRPPSLSDRSMQTGVRVESDHDNRRTSDQDNRWFAPCAAGGLSYCIAA
jgi:hypothetical protein